MGLYFGIPQFQVTRYKALKLPKYLAASPELTVPST